MAMVIPLATMLMGHATNYSEELEMGIALRFKLFAFKESTLLIAKLISYMIFLTLSFIIYSLVIIFMLGIMTPNIGALFTFVIFFFTYSIILFVLGHAIAILCNWSRLTFGIVMAVYFGLMVLGGNMGVQPTMLPIGMKQLAMVFPMYYVSTYFLSFWNGGVFEWLAFILSTGGLTIISFGLFMLSSWLSKRRIKKLNK